MRLAIDDLPSISSRLRALGEIRPDDKTTVVTFPRPDDAPTFVVALQHIRFPNGGGWSFFQCPCGRRARTLRLYDGSPACKHCLEARGLRYRVEDLSRPERAAHVAARLAARLAAAATPMRGLSLICATARLSGAGGSRRRCGDVSTQPIGMIFGISFRRAAASDAPSETSGRLR